LPANRTASQTGVLAIDQVLLEEYLRRHFSDPSIAVTGCRRLPGGFGKETYLFTAVGAAIGGDFVLRRDPVVNLVPYACRRVAKEYEVLRALQAEGFPSPEALWLDTQHLSIPGGDFIVMRRSPGISGGTLFGATQRPESELSGRLGAMVGQLHALPPLYSLGSLTESIHPELWTMPVCEVVRKYLLDFRTLLTESRHSASPATVAIFNWLIGNVPKSDARPCLVHGDIGFHNILLDRGNLTTLLDWERAHIGHPGEDLAYLYNAAGEDLDWGRLVDQYRLAGGTELSPIDLLYFRIMSQACNAVTTNIPAARMLAGETADIRMLAVKYQMRPQILKFLGELIGSYPASLSSQRAHQ
jgi:aminoglycoside phosphotransferase (APT) family kinase protein